MYNQPSDYSSHQGSRNNYGCYKKQAFANIDYINDPNGFTKANNKFHKYLSDNNNGPYKIITPTGLASYNDWTQKCAEACNDINNKDANGNYCTMFDMYYYNWDTPQCRLYSVSMTPDNYTINDGVSNNLFIYKRSSGGVYETIPQNYTLLNNSHHSHCKNKVTNGNEMSQLYGNNSTTLQQCADACTSPTVNTSNGYPCTGFDYTDNGCYLWYLDPTSYKTEQNATFNSKAQGCFVSSNLPADLYTLNTSESSKYNVLSGNYSYCRPKGKENASYDEYKSYIIGNTIFNVNINKCAESCDRDISCTSFDYGTTGGCTLWNATDIVGLTGKVNMNRGCYSKKASLKGNNSSNYTLVNNNYNGYCTSNTDNLNRNDYIISCNYSADINSCAQKCSENTQCSAFDWGVPITDASNCCLWALQPADISAADGNPVRNTGCYMNTAQYVNSSQILINDPPNYSKARGDKHFHTFIHGSTDTSYNNASRVTSWNNWTSQCANMCNGYKDANGYPCTMFNMYWTDSSNYGCELHSNAKSTSGYSLLPGNDRNMYSYVSNTAPQEILKDVHRTEYKVMNNVACTSQNDSPNRVNYVLNSNDYDVIDISNCADRCNKDNRCTAFDYNTTISGGTYTNYCSLFSFRPNDIIGSSSFGNNYSGCYTKKDTSNYYNTLITDTNGDSYTRMNEYHSYCRPTGLENANLSQYSQYILQTTNKNVDECSTSCDTNPQCTSFDVCGNVCNLWKMNDISGVVGGSTNMGCYKRNIIPTRRQAKNLGCFVVDSTTGLQTNAPSYVDTYEKCKNYSAMYGHELFSLENYNNNNGKIICKVGDISNVNLIANNNTSSCIKMSDNHMSGSSQSTAQSIYQFTDTLPNYSYEGCYSNVKNVSFTPVSNVHSFQDCEKYAFNNKHFLFTVDNSNNTCYYSDATDYNGVKTEGCTTDMNGNHFSLNGTYTAIYKSALTNASTI
jgi:hypothetical protein